MSPARCRAFFDRDRHELSGSNRRGLCSVEQAQAAGRGEGCARAESGHKAEAGKEEGRIGMPRYDKLSPDQLETISAFLEESDTIEQ